MIISFTNVIGAIRSLGEAAQVITTNLKMWLGFETSETIGKNIYDGGITNEANGGTFTDNGNGTFTVTGDGSPNLGIGVRDVDADYLTVGGTYKFSAQGANTTLAVYNSSFVLLKSGINSVEFQATTSSMKLYISPTNGVSATYSDVEVREITQITHDKSGNNNVGELFTGKALEFDGVNDRVVIDFTTQIKSAVFWVKPLGTGVESILGFGGVASVAKYIKSDSNNIQSAGLSSVSVYVNGVSTTSVPVNQWSRVVVNFALLTPQRLQFGYGYNSLGNIQLSDVQLYNENLSTDDIAYDYANPNKLAIDNPSTSLSVTNLKGYWALSEGAGSLTYDSSGEGNNGTINGATYEPAQPRIPQLGMQNWSKGSNLFPYSEDFTEWIISPSTSQAVLAPTEAAPYGQGDVYSIIIQASESDAYIRYATTNATLTSSTHSVWVKQAPTGSATHIRITNNNRAAWNTGTSEKIALTSSWQRLETTDSITGIRFTIIGSADASGTQDPDCLGKVLIYGAQLVEGSSAGAYRFTDGAATSNSTVIANPTIPTQDIFGNLVRDRLNSFNLDGSGYSSVANSSSLQFGTSAFTIQAWIKPFSLVSNNRILTKGVTGNGEFMISVGGDNASVRVFAKDSNGNSLDTTNFFSTLTINSWQMITVIIDTPNDQILFFKNDGNVETNTGASWTGNFNNTEPITIGNTSSVSAGQFFDGLVSDALVYDRALTSDEVENNYNAGLSAHRN